MNKVEVVKRAPLFTGLTEEDWEDVTDLLVERCYAKDAFIFFEGDSPQAIYVVWVGQVKLLHHSEEGRDIVTEVLGSGRMFGEMAVFDGTPYSATAQTMEPTAVVSIARKDYLSLLQRYPSVAIAVVGELTRRLRSALVLARSLAVEKVTQRIARLLLKLASANGRAADDGMVIDIPLTRQDIADMTGTTVETAIRVLSRFRRMGWVQTRRGRVVVTNPDALAELADGALPPPTL